MRKHVRNFLIPISMLLFTGLILGCAVKSTQVSKNRYEITSGDWDSANKEAKKLCPNGYMVIDKFINNAGYCLTIVKCENVKKKRQ